MRLFGKNMSMFGVLRVKFVAFTMVCVCVITALAFAAIYAMDHQQRIAEVKQALESEIALTIDEPLRSLGATGSSRGSTALKGPGGPRDLRANMLPVAVYYLPFSSAALLDGSLLGPLLNGGPLEDGAQEQGSQLEQLLDVNDAQVVSAMKLSDGIARKALQETVSARGDFGELPGLDLFFQKRITGDGAYLAFIDASAVHGANGLIAALVSAGIGIMLVSFIVSYVLSARVLAPVKEAWEGQRRFIANASHELKTPLAVILANNSIVMKHAEDTVVSQSQWLESTQREAQEMQSLIEDMLTMAQLDEADGASSLMGAGEKEPVDLSYELERIVLQFESIGLEQQIVCHQDIQEGIEANTVKPAVQRVMSALLDNAYKYAGRGGWISVSLARQEGKARLVVGNSGQYISAEDLPHIFDRFYKADTSHTEKGSFGLGLSIVHGLVEGLGGTMAVTSSQTEGTFFTVELPLQ